MRMNSRRIDGNRKADQTEDDIAGGMIDVLSNEVEPIKIPRVVLGVIIPLLHHSIRWALIGLAR